MTERLGIELHRHLHRLRLIGEIVAAMARGEGPNDAFIAHVRAVHPPSDPLRIEPGVEDARRRSAIPPRDAQHAINRYFGLEEIELAGD